MLFGKEVGDLIFFLVICEWLKATNDGDIIYSEQIFIKQNFFLSEMKRHGKACRINKINEFIEAQTDMIFAKYRPQEKVIEVNMTSKLFSVFLYHYNSPGVWTPHGLM